MRKPNHEDRREADAQAESTQDRHTWGELAAFEAFPFERVRELLGFIQQLRILGGDTQPLHVSEALMLLGADLNEAVFLAERSNRGSLAYRVALNQAVATMRVLNAVIDGMTRAEPRTEDLTRMRSRLLC